MHGHILTDAHLTADLIGFTIGLVVASLLLALTIRAARLPGTPIANIFVALVAVAWNTGGLAHAVALAAGTPRSDERLLSAVALQFTGATLWPVAMLVVWRPFAVLTWQKLGFRILQLVAPAVGLVLVLLLWLPVAGIALVPGDAVKEFTAFSGSLLALGALIFLRAPHTFPGAWFSSLTILVGVAATALSIVIRSTFHVSDATDAALVVASKQSPLLILLGSFFVFARFRFADVFIRQSLRIVLAAACATGLVVSLWAGFLSELSSLTPFPTAIHLVTGSALGTTMLMAFSVTDRALGRLVDRWIVRIPDYSSATRQLGERLRQLHREPDIISAAQEAARSTLGLDEVHWVPKGILPDSVWTAEMRDGICELEEDHPLKRLLSLSNLEVLVPVRIEGELAAVLAVSPGEARRGLVTHELEYLQVVATQVGARLDALGLEREMVERENRETVLRQQLTEAELRALRAQVNPHFLFNSLNTIADLIVSNPRSAEAMTVRLAKVFRHVLAHASRPLTSIREEAEFLRTYLQIEEARFGGRFHAHIDVASDVAQQQIPSLVLQPLVENALKHGLAPKPGPVHLWISACAQGECVRLMVEDDGIGTSTQATLSVANDGLASSLPTRPARPGFGVGLSNVARRLAVMYEDRASVTLEGRTGGGTRAVVVLPRGATTAVA